MQSHPATAPLKTDHYHAIAPQQLWATLTVNQQQQVCQIFIVIFQQYLTLLTDESITEESSDDYESEHE